MKVLRTILLMVGIMAFLPNYIHANANTNTKIFVNDSLISFQEPLFVEHGRVYVPVRFVGEQLGAAVEWNGAERSVLVKSPIKDNLKFYLDSKSVILNGAQYNMDVSPIVRYERMYLPVRHVSEFLHLKVKWSGEQNSIHLNSVPLYEVQSGDSLTTISKQFNTSAQMIRVRNSLDSYTVHTGTNLKVVIPFVMENRADITLLAKLIEAESGSEPFLGQVGIGNVILNRVKDSRFPNTIDSVINQVGQFTPVATGKINTVEPSQSALEAAEKAIQGDKPVGDALYFFNPGNTANTFLQTREVIIDIGNHRFSR